MQEISMNQTSHNLKTQSFKHDKLLKVLQTSRSASRWLFGHDLSLRHGMRCIHSYNTPHVNSHSAIMIIRIRRMYSSNHWAILISSWSQADMIRWVMPHLHQHKQPHSSYQASFQLFLPEWNISFHGKNILSDKQLQAQQSAEWQPTLRLWSLEIL